MRKYLSVKLVAFVGLLLVGAGTETYGQEVVKRSNPIVKAVRKVMPSIVSIKVERQGNWGKKEGSGTGVIIDERGYLVTNHHVIAGGYRFAVTLNDKSEHAVTVHTDDPRNDLAILKLPGGKKYPALSFGPASDLEVGETVIAIGHPYGFQNTVSTGIVSALDRTIAMPTGERLTGLIQITASINPGNSGGPLLNINGELIGINVALREGAQGIAFALNADTVQSVLAKHLSALNLSGVKHGLLVKETVLRPEGRDRQQVVVEQVAANSPVAEAGLKSGDVIVKLAGRSVANRFDVERAFWGHKAGEKVQAAVLRQGRETSLALTLVPGTSTGVASNTRDTGSSAGADPVQTASHR